MLNWVQTGYKFNMSKNLEHPHISKNGGKQFYLQFHIKPWMKHFMPAEYRNRKNFKKSLKTPNLTEALNKMHIVLSSLGLALNPRTQEIVPHPSTISTVTERAQTEKLENETPEEAYHRARANASKLSQADLMQSIEIEDDMFHELIEESYEKDPDKAKTLAAQHYAKQDGYFRVLNQEDNALHPKPHKYETTLLAAARLLVQEYEDEERNPKQLGKVLISTKKFLDFLGVDDLILTQITKRHVSKYINESRKKDIPLNTFSMELGLLDKIFKVAEAEGVISDNFSNPFLGHRPLKGFKTEVPKGIFTPEHAEILANEAIDKKRYDILTTVAVSYYTGMRSSELFECSLIEINGITCFDIRDGKTHSSIRRTPIHDHLKSWLQTNQIMPKLGSSFDWSAPTKDAFNKRFNTFSNRNLIIKHGVSEENGTLSHHSFRHGMSTRLFELGLNELQVAHVVGHSRKTAAQTTSGKAYIRVSEVPEILEFIRRIKPIKLPNIKHELRGLKL